MAGNIEHCNLYNYLDKAGAAVGNNTDLWEKHSCFFIDIVLIFQ